MNNILRKYGDECYSFNTPKAEVDFYILAESLAIQVAYSIADRDTRKRETDALLALSDYKMRNICRLLPRMRKKHLKKAGKLFTSAHYGNG